MQKWNGHCVKYLLFQMYLTLHTETLTITIRNIIS